MSTRRAEARGLRRENRFRQFPDRPLAAARHRASADDTWRGPDTRFAKLLIRLIRRWAPRRELGLRLSAHWSMTATPASRNGLVSRVAIANPLVVAIAAIWPSATPVIRPVASVFAAVRAASSAAARSNGMIREPTSRNKVKSNAVRRSDFRFQSGRRSRPKRSSMTFTVVVQRAPSCCPFSQFTTWASGSGRIGSEITFVSRMITKNLPL